MPGIKSLPIDPSVWDFQGDYDLIVNKKTGDQYSLLQNGKIFKATDSSNQSFVQSGTAPSSSNVQTELRRVVWVEQFGAVGDGTTDCTTAFANAITQASGGTVRIGEGTFIVSAISLPTDTVLQGSGFGTVLKHKANSTLDLIKLADSTSTLRVQVRDLQIDGNSSNQTNALHGINLDNTGSSSTVIARHVLRNLYVANCKGDGVHMGALTRESLVRDVYIYNCDDNGLEIAGADSQFSNIIVGQSGADGVRVSGSACILANIKSWYSGRITSGSAGFLFRNSLNIVGTGLYSQENSGHGFSLFGQSGALKGHFLQGIADGDNTAASTFAGWNLNNVDGAIIIAKTTKYPAATGTPNYGMGISSNTTNCKIVLDSDSTNSFALNGVNANTNDITVNKTGRTLKSDVGDAAATLTGGTSEETQIWNTALTTTRAVTLTTSPAWAGLKFRIERTSSATGNFPLNVGTGPLAVLAAGEFCEVAFNGTSWVLVTRSSLGKDGVSSDNGDAAKTLTVGTDVKTQVWNTALTADRAVTLNTGIARTGDRFRIVRGSSATGAFNLNVGSGPLKALGSASTWCEVEYDGSAWKLTANGSL